MALSSLLAVCFTAYVAAAPAHASHLKGASIDATIDAAGQLTGTVSLIKANYGDCDPNNIYPEIGSVQFQATGDGSPTSITVASQDTSITACNPGSITTTATFSESIAGKPDGDVTIQMFSSARVGGIQNTAPSGITVRAKVRKQAGFTHKSPKLTSQPSLGISTKAAYAQQFAMSTESGAAPTVKLLQSANSGDTATYDSTAPQTNLVSISSGGLVEIPFSTTSGLTVGHYYVYKARVQDEFGQYVERDLLLTVSNNTPPVFSADSATGVIDINPETTTNLTFAASDPDAGQTVLMAVGGVPSWGSSTVTSGDAKVSLNPPASAIGSVVQIAVDATDSDVSAPMTSARTVTVRVVAPSTPTTPQPPVAVPPAPQLVSGPPAATTSREATITWTGSGGGSFSCVIDGRPPVACSSPLKLTNLSPGKHNVRVFQSNDSGAGAILDVSWAVTEAKLDVAAKLAVESDDLQVGCKVSGVNIEKCVVDVFADVPSSGGRARAAKLTKIGTGEITTNKTTNAVSIKLKLTETGKRLVNRLGGLKVKLNMTAFPKGGGATLKATGNSVLLPSRVAVIPATGLFAFQSAKLTPVAKAWVRRTAKQLTSATTVTCTGHTSRSGTGDPEANRKLGLARAKAICAALKAGGAKVKTTAVTVGETKPRASNRSEAGRALNRRVELVVGYKR
ncbi:MAG: OmpA family protein [Solirubrobacteraceae bacterium]|nr:OmpA family protein [Solirubrobacteraceae bacterium]